MLRLSSVREGVRIAASASFSSHMRSLFGAPLRGFHAAAVLCGIKPGRILMPSMSPTMTEGNLKHWLKKEGERVRAGEVLLEIETDKASIEVEASEDAVIAKILVPAGSQRIPVNTLIALTVEDGQDPSKIDIPPEATQPAASPMPPPAPKPATVTAPAPATAHKAPSSSHAAPHALPAGIFLSPAVRAAVLANNVDVTKVKGSGKKGRILKGDVLEYVASGGRSSAASPSAAKAADASAKAPASSAAATQAAATDAYVDIPLTNVRRVIATRLSEAKATIPHAYADMECRLDALLALRKRLAEAEGGKVSVNDFIVKAAAIALRQVPEINVTLDVASGEAKRLPAVDIAVAVATERGLITPIVKGADGLGVGAISQKVKELADRAKTGKLRPEEFQGGSFSISNLGMFGISSFTAVINPPQTAILAVGGGLRTVGVDAEGKPAVKTVMSVRLSYDARAADQENAAKFLEAFRGFIEQPTRLL